MTARGKTKHKVGRTSVGAIGCTPDLLLWAASYKTGTGISYYDRNNFERALVGIYEITLIDNSKDRTDLNI